MLRARFFVFALAAVGAPLASAGCHSVAHRPDGSEGPLPLGADAPDVEAYDVNGVPSHLSSLRGEPVVVYFYPKDGTPGCTTEACAFRDAWKRFELAHVGVIGVSPQSRESHVAFQKEKNLPFPLVPDEAGTAQRAYGVAKGVFGYARVSFLVDAKGKIARVWPNVNPAIHADDVLAAAAALPR